MTTIFFATRVADSDKSAGVSRRGGGGNEFHFSSAPVSECPFVTLIT